MPRIRLSALLAAGLLLSALPLSPAAADSGDKPTDKPTVGLRYPCLTPDGKWVVFDYRGDIWRAPADGTGHADRLTIHEAQDTLPRVSPDGTKIAFASKRNGAYDLFVMGIDGGLPKQVTFHSGVELLCDWSPDGKRLLFLSNRDPSLYRLDIYEMDVDGGTARRITRDGGREATYSADGKSIVYTRGFNTIYQDNYEGSANYDLYTVGVDGGAEGGAEGGVDGGVPRCLTCSAGNERYPFLSKDGKRLFFVAEEKGVANFFSMPLAGGARTQITKFDGLDVQRPWIDADRKVAVFERGGRLFTTDLTAQDPRPAEIPLTIKSDVRNSGLETRTITDGGEQAHVSADGQKLAFALRGDVWTMPAAGGQGSRLVASPSKEEWPRWSPDGTRLAYQSDAGGNNDVYVMDLKSGKSTAVVKSPQDDFFASWSPDGTRLVFSSERTGNREIWSIELATAKETQLTDNPAADDDPVYSADGRFVAFDSGREGGQAIYVMPAEGGPARRVTEGTGFFQVPSWSPDGTLLAFESFVPESGSSGGLFVVSSQGGAAMQISRDGAGACWTARDWIYFTADRPKDGGVYRVVAPKAVNAGERVPFLGRIEVDRRRELGDLFDEAWTRLRDGFYDPKMHGVDWDRMREKYRDMAVDAENKDVFYNVVSQMLAELNASHLGISGGDDGDDTPSPRVVETGYLGADLAPSAEEEGARRIAAVFPKGPVDEAGLRIGDVITTINGQRLKKDSDLDRILEGTAGREIQVAYKPLSESGLGVEKSATVKPIPMGRLAAMDHQRWLETSSKAVKEGTKGRAGYVHLDGMDQGNLTKFQQMVARWNQDKQNRGMVLDIRENGGGNIHTALMEVFQARPFVQLQPRGGPKVTQPNLYWDKPVVLLVNERSFSDAEVFPWSFQTAKIGKVVGVPTPGGVIGTNDVTLSDGSKFRIPRVGWYSLAGKRLEGNGFVPDVIVVETPEDRAAGRDPQLTKAIEVLVAEMDARAKTAPQLAEEKPPTPEPTKPADSPTSPTPPVPPQPRPTGPAGAGDPLADAKPGEWVRYRVGFPGTDPTVLLVRVEAVEGGKVRFSKTMEEGGGFIPPLPDEADQVPLVQALPLFGHLGSHSTSTADVKGHAAEVFLATVDMGGVEAVLVFTNDVPGLGLLRVEVNKQTVLEALEWGSAPPTPSSESPRSADPATPPTPTAPPPAPAPDPAPSPSRPVPSHPDGGEAGGEEGGSGQDSESIPNPLYDAKVGEWIRFRNVVQGQETIVTLTVTEVTDDVVVLESATKHGETAIKGDPVRRKRTATLGFRGQSAPIVSKEAITVAGKSLDCTVVTVKSRRGPDISTWYAPEVPVTGLVRRVRDGKVVAELLEWGTAGTSPSGS